MANPDADLLLNEESSVAKRLTVAVRVRIHVGAMGRSVDEQGQNLRRHVLNDAQGVPGVYASVRQHDSAAGKLQSSVFDVGLHDGVLQKLLVELRAKHVHALSYEEVHWEVLSERLCV